MGFFSKVEGKMEDTFEGAADKMFDAPISPVQIAKKAEKQMRREKMVGAGKQFAPTLFTVLVNEDDDRRLFGYYPTLAGETETFLAAKAAEQGLVMDGQPLVRFIVDDGLKRGKFDVIAEPVAAPIVSQLRAEEMQRYGLVGRSNGFHGGPNGYAPAPAAQPQGYGANGRYTQRPPQQAYRPAPSPYDAYEPENLREQPLPYVPADEIDYSIDYGEYTFDSRDFASDQARDQQAARADSRPVGQGRSSQAPSQPVAGGRAASQPFDQGRAQSQPFASQPQAPSRPFAQAASRPFSSAQSPANSMPHAAHGARNAQAASLPLSPEQLASMPANRAHALSQPFPQGHGAAAAGAVAGAAVAGAAVAGAAHSRGVASQPFEALPSVPMRAANTVPTGEGNRPAPPLATLVDTANGTVYPLSLSKVTLGRESDNGVQVRDINASRHHAALVLQPQGVWVVTDLGSTNGTLVNGQEVATMPLKYGDRITLGTTELVLQP